MNITKTYIRNILPIESIAKFDIAVRTILPLSCAYAPTRRATMKSKQQIVKTVSIRFMFKFKVRFIISLILTFDCYSISIFKNN